MRQAIIIKNPKWEPFSTASDAFKKLKETEPAVLVVRGRCKERKVKKAILKTAAVIALMIGACLQSNAQQNLIANLPSTTANSFATNWTSGTGLVGWNQDAVATVQLTVRSTNALANGNVVIPFDTTDNGTDWLTNRYEITAPIWGTNNGTALVRITNSIGGKYLRVGGVKNQATGSTNTATVTAFSISIK